MLLPIELLQRIHSSSSSITTISFIQITIIEILESWNPLLHAVSDTTLFILYLIINSNLGLIILIRSYQTFHKTCLTFFPIIYTLYFLSSVLLFVVSSSGCYTIIFPSFHLPGLRVRFAPIVEFLLNIFLSLVLFS